MLDELKEAVISGDSEKSKEITQKLINSGKDPGMVLKDGLIAGMDVVGKRFKAYEMYIPEVLMSANAMKVAMNILKPLLSESDIPSMGKIVMATIEGDLHDIGKNLVSMMLEGAGFEIIDLGVDVPVIEIIEESKKHNVDIIGISALLTTTMLGMEGAIKSIRESGISAKVMIGGAPITQDYADKIKADGFAPDALRAIDLAKRLMSV